MFPSHDLAVTSFTIASASFLGSIDNVRLVEAIEDRSVKASTANVVGTISRTVVNTGADLVAYSGFSASDYIEEAYSADLDYGTGDFYQICWVRGASQPDVITSRASSFELYTTGGNRPRWIVNGVVNDGTTDLGDGNWHLVVGVRRSGVSEIWVDAALENTVAAAGSVNSAVVWRIGDRTASSFPFDGDIALLRNIYGS